MEEFRFLNWSAYKDSKSLVKEIYLITNKLPGHHKFDLGSQLNRAVTSITLNIAEGSGKSSDRDLNRFFNIAIGSAYETIACLDICFDNQFINKIEFEELTKKCMDITRQLGNFKKKLNS